MKNNIIAFLAEFILFVYKRYIKEDFDVLTPFGKICIYPAWFIHAIFIWAISPMFIPEFLFVRSQLYKNFELFVKLNRK